MNYLEGDGHNELVDTIPECVWGDLRKSPKDVIQCSISLSLYWNVASPETISPRES
jgi:hypothetical protein